MKFALIIHFIMVGDVTVGDFQTRERCEQAGRDFVSILERYNAKGLHRFTCVGER